MTPTPDRQAPSELDGYEVLVAVCGGIAAYKVCELVSRLVQRGAGVTVAMTRAARKFVGPVTFGALCGRRVLTNLWHANEPTHVQHIASTDEADLLVIAPATANIIGKMAGGIADDLVSTLAISTASPILLAPAMNDRMWENPIVQRNVKTLAEQGVRIIGPGQGWLACGSLGAGRMAEAEEILEAAVALLMSEPSRNKLKSE